MPLYGLVLAGGQSSRMKTDKGALKIEGQTLRQRAAQALASSCEKVFLSARHDQNIPEWSAEDIIFDELKDIGPAAALLAAHQKFPEADWFILACDFPKLHNVLIENLLPFYEDKQYEIICYEHEDRTPEPLFAIWTRESLDSLSKNIVLNHKGPRFTLEHSKTFCVKPENPGDLFNANTPEDWHSAGFKS